MAPNDPCTTANIATTATKVAGLLSAGAKTTMDAIAMMPVNATVPMIDGSVAISKTYFIELIYSMELFFTLKKLMGC